MDALYIYLQTVWKYENNSISQYTSKGSSCPSISPSPLRPFLLPSPLLSSLSCICKEKMQKLKIGNELLMGFPFVKVKVLFVLVFPL